MPIGIVRALIPRLLLATLVMSASVMSAQGDPATAAARELPLEPVARLFGMPLINIHLSNPDSHNHSFDENLRLGNLWDGIEQAAALLLMDVSSK